MVQENRETLVVNLFAGPGAGKTTCAWLIAGELKKQNIVTEYVSEYAKALVWAGKMELLDGSAASQHWLLGEQDQRIRRLEGKVDVIVTDGPLLLNPLYAKEGKAELERSALRRHGEKQNFNLFIQRGAGFETEGRMQNLEESRGIDREVRALLQRNEIYFGTYTHRNLDIVVQNIQTTLRRIQCQNQPRTAQAERPAPEKKRLFVDMDGTLAAWENQTMETLLEEGYFRNRPPYDTVVEAVGILARERPDIEVHILSAVLADSKYALAEKSAWLDQHLPQIDPDRRIFLPCGEDKQQYIPGGLRPGDTLLDDYTQNLRSWEAPGKAVKLLNGVNYNRGTWAGDRIRYDKAPREIAQNLADLIHGKSHIYDTRPQDTQVHRDRQSIKERIVAVQSRESQPSAARLPGQSTAQKR